MAQIPPTYAKLPRHSAQGHLVTPALIDCHSHIVFGGDRAADYFLSHGLSHPEGMTKIRERGGYYASMVPSVPYAYRRLMEMLTRDSATAIQSGDLDPKGRLVAFVSASLRPPVVDPKRLGLWAGFLNQCPPVSIHKPSNLTAAPKRPDWPETTFLQPWH